MSESRNDLGVFPELLPDEEMLPDPEEQDLSFVVDDDRKAEWCLRKIREAEEEKKTWKAFYADRYEKICKAADSRIERLMLHLARYFSTVPHRVSDTQESYLLPNGKLVMKKREVKYDYSTLHDEAPDEFFMYFFKYRDILMKDIAFLYPVSKKNEKKDGTSCTFATDLIKPIKNVAEVNPGIDFKRLSYSPSDIYFAMPWLYNASTADFIEISEKYPEEFDLFTRTIEKIAKTTDNKFDVQKKLLVDLKDAKDNIRIACKREKDKLAKRGIITFVGVAFTIFTITNPEFFEWITKDMSKLRTIVGAASLKETLFLLADYSSLNKIGVDNPYSVILKWEKKTKKYGVEP